MIAVKMRFGSMRVVWRGFHTTYLRLAVDKALLSKLRKKTGFPFISCKKALEKFDSDMKQAEQWLREQAQKEGWSKASKLQGRPMSQGLVAIVTENNMAAMVEVNCETDFVARNEKFRNLVSKAANICLQQGKNSSQDKLLLDKEEVNKLPGGETGSLADLVALTIGNIGENMALRRAAFLRAGEIAKLGIYVHAAGPHETKDHQCVMGRYGALVSFTQNGDTIEGSISSEELGRQLCQHIVGMNPKTIEPLETEAEETEGNDIAHQVNDKEVISEEKGNEEVEDKHNEEDNSEEEVCVEEVEEKDETAMLLQEFLLDSTLTVKEYIEQNEAKVLDFIRFECGEPLPGEED